MRESARYKQFSHSSNPAPTEAYPISDVLIPPGGQCSTAQPGCTTAVPLLVVISLVYIVQCRYNQGTCFSEGWDVSWPDRLFVFYWLQNCEGMSQIFEKDSSVFLFLYQIFKGELEQPAEEAEEDALNLKISLFLYFSVSLFPYVIFIK